MFGSVPVISGRTPYSLVTSMTGLSVTAPTSSPGLPGSTPAGQSVAAKQLFSPSPLAAGYQTVNRQSGSLKGPRCF